MESVEARIARHEAYFENLIRSPDSNVEKNRQMLLERSLVGLKKYGVTTDRTDVDLEDWLHHALEEVLDMANYLQAAITKVNAANPWKQAIDDEMVCLHIGVAKGDPKKCLDAIINWNVECALDPTVSEAARKLIERGIAIGRSEVITQHDDQITAI